MADLLGRQVAASDPLTVCYARVSSHDQKDDLERQHAVLEAYCAAKGWRTRVIRDLGSGMNYQKKGLQELLELILSRRTVTVQQLCLMSRGSNDDCRSDVPPG